ncbi:MAG: HAMP domain-containing protein, partial [Acidobacteriota bacterium]
AFAAEVTRVAREVGTEGMLGGQADVKGVSGTWRDLTDSVNQMAANLTSQVRNIAGVTTAVANGDLSRKITVEAKGEILELKNTINTMVDRLNAFAAEVTRVAREVGTEGKLGGQATVQGVAGTWKDLTDNVNQMAANLTSQVRNIAGVTTAVANGDLSTKITVDVRGEILELKNTINAMVDRLNAFAAEVTRVAREVGTEGKLGGQADVKGVSGTWRDLTDNVNQMAANLTSQVRGIAKVVTSVANGNLRLKLMVEAKGEIAELADTINSMIETLATFADQVTSVAREVGVEGKLGGQASVPGAAGTWKDLTDNVNQLAANLTTQVRAIAEVATAVTKGDLTRSIRVEARGEVAVLKDNVNEMIRNLRDTTQKTTEQDWLKTNLAKFTRMLQGQRDLMAVSKMILSELAPVVGAQHGVFYRMEAPQTGEQRLKLLATYAYRERKHLATEFKPGEGLVGQCALEKERILLTNVPGDYIQVASGLGEAPPLNIIVLPVLFEGAVRAVIEMASFERFSPIHQTFLDQLTESIGIVLNTIEANTRTEELLSQSQNMASELQSQQEELRQTNEELEEKARALSAQKTEVERKNREIEVARKELEDKAAQLGLTSKYKSEFLSSMSHELRTPLTSLLLLAQQLHENAEGNLTTRQIEFVRTIHAAGGDLLALINDILDLSKIESGTVTLEVGEAPFGDLKDQLDGAFRHVAQNKGLAFDVELAPGLPRALYTDAKRLQQVLKNLLSNAFKFTEKGEVRLRIAPATSGWSHDCEPLNRARAVIGFAVGDTGIGIPLDKQRIVFEAFQQADGTTSRRYGGTGLGLSISREIAQLLGGEIKLISAPGQGSTFTLYLPLTYAPLRGRTGRGPRADTEAGELEPALKPAGARPDTAARGRPSTRIGNSARARADPAPRGPERATPVLVEAHPAIEDDRGRLQPGDRLVLIIEDDLDFGRLLLDQARQKTFKGLVAPDGASGLEMAKQYTPDAITLDIRLPDIDGWALLDLLKHDPATRHIPVHIISVEESGPRGRKSGAIAHLQKPVTREAIEGAFNRLNGLVERREKKLLLVEPDPAQRQRIQELVGGE